LEDHVKVVGLASGALGAYLIDAGEDIRVPLTVCGRHIAVLYRARVIVIIEIGTRAGIVRDAIARDRACDAVIVDRIDSRGRPQNGGNDA
jgi:hypothetical protein